MKANPLLDNIFLEKLFTAYDREIYAKITALNFDELPTEEISGKVTGGSINVDGTSACRRTCSSTLVANEVNINDYYWGLNTKFELQIGLTNRIDEKYPDIIWFKEGIYLITTFSTALVTSNYTINIQGNNKIGLLDGTIGGSLTALSYDFGREDYTDENGVSHRRKLPIRDIVTELIHEYAHEPWENIIVQDLDDFGVELLQYRGTATNPLYLFFNINSQEVEQMTLDGSFTVYKGRQISCTISNIENIVFEVNDKGEEVKGKYYNLNELYTVSNPTAFKLNRNDEEENYYIIKITTGQTCGYRMTDITYAGDLIANVGETVVSVLDKICKMLGDFEYYYDTDGKFIFKRKNQYIYKSFNHHTTTESSQSYVENSAYISPTVWDFTGSTLVTSFNNTPNLSELKNDYSLWGTRKSLTGNDLPVHLRYAIDKKPIYYKTLRGDEYGTTMFIDQIRDEITKEVHREMDIVINDYTIQHKLPGDLPGPQLYPDGSLRGGWWDIRDWYEYYKILTGNEPNGTIKWYTQNDLTGLVSAHETITQLELYKDHISNWAEMYNRYYNDTDTLVWMITLTPTREQNKYKLSWGHSYGSYSQANYESNFYVSHLENGKVVTKKAEPPKKRIINRPMSGCSDSHTYLTFLYETTYTLSGEPTGGAAYLYNPNFTYVNDGMDYNEIIEETINRRVEEKLKDIIIVDWREIIYQMAIDYRRFNHCDDFGLKVQEINGKQFDGKYIYPRGVTGYEQYYVDMEGFWRQIYCPQYDYTTITLSENQYVNAKPGEYFVKYWNTDDENCYEARYLYKDITTADLTYNDISNGVLHTVSSPYNLTTTYYYKPDPNEWIDGWNPIVDNSPESLNFWFDFLDDGGDIERYGTSFVGDRPKAVNDSMIKSIYFRETPTLIFTDNIAKIDKKLGYSYLQYSPAMASLFTMSTQGKDAIDVLYEHLYKNSYCIESVTVNALPIYHLEPNNMINIFDTRAGINGTYVMTKFTLPLTYNGTMSITATKAVEEIF